MHSPEPWHRKSHETMQTEAIYDANEKCVVDVAWYENHEDNAEHIVACVNACRHWKTEELQGIVFDKAHVDDTISTVLVMRLAPEIGE